MPHDLPSERAMVRRTTHFSGRVQGVGFRYTTQRIAERFAVTGYVRNLTDGRVELVAEGREDQVDAFHGAVEREMSGYIESQHATTAAATGEFDAFRITF